MAEAESVSGFVVGCARPIPGVAQKSKLSQAGKSETFRTSGRHSRKANFTSTILGGIHSRFAQEAAMPPDVRKCYALPADALSLIGLCPNCLGATQR